MEGEQDSRGKERVISGVGERFQELISFDRFEGNILVLIERLTKGAVHILMHYSQRVLSVFQR